MKRTLLVGMAAIALAGGPALAQGKGGGQGGEKGGGNDHAGGAMQAAETPGNPGRGKSDAKPDRGNSGGAQAQRETGMGSASDKGSASGKGNSAGPGPTMAQGRAAETRGNGNQGNRADSSDRSQGRGDAEPIRTISMRDVFATNSHGLINGCPPGLADKSNGCRPPGLARQDDAAWRNSLFRPEWWGLSGLGDGRYGYGDGYLYRLGSNGGIASFIPLLGGALGIGNTWPSYYQPVPLPRYYQDYYGLGPPDGYRYADNVIYGVDPGTSAITSIEALLTGDNFTVGQQLPLGYDAYNVPYGYRDRYADTPDAMYRYSDGYIYQVDPTTRLISAAIELLV